MAIEKLYSPLFCQYIDDGGSGDYLERPVSQEAAIYHEEAIHEALIRARLPNDVSRGLMSGYRYQRQGGDSIDRKVRSLFVDVEIIDEKLWGVATLELVEPLTQDELASLKDFLSGQYSDGFGDGFEQRSIDTESGELSVSLWASGDEFFIDTEREFRQRLGLKPPEEQRVPTQAAHDKHADPGMISQRDRLIDRLNRNLSDYFDTLRRLDSKGIAGMSSKIAAQMEAYYCLTKVHSLSNDELAYFLKFKDPLSVMADELQMNGLEDYSDVMWDILEKEDALQGDYELASEIVDEEALMPELFARLDKNFSNYCNTLMAAEKSELIGMAAKIAAHSAACEYMKERYEYQPGEVQYLLGFQNPLAMIADGWPNTLEGLIDIDDIVSEIIEEKSEHRDYEPASNDPTYASTPIALDDSQEKLSVLSQLREAEKSLRESNKDKPRQNPIRSGQER